MDINEKVVNVTFSGGDQGTVKWLLYKYLERNSAKSSSKETRTLKREKDLSKIGEHLCCELELNLGEINKDFHKGRIDVLSMMYMPFGCDEDEIKEILKDRLDQVDKIIQRAKRGYTLRLWTSEGSYDRCGYYYLLDKLKNVDANIVECHTDLNSWSQIGVDDLANFELKDRRVDKKEIEEISQKWLMLVENSLDLRILKDDELVNASSDYYDDVIRRLMPKRKNIKAHTLCGNVLQKIDAYIQSYFIMDRIFKLIENGEFEIVRKFGPDSRPQNVVIKIKEE